MPSRRSSKKGVCVCESGFFRFLHQDQQRPLGPLAAMSSKAPTRKPATTSKAAGSKVPASKVGATSKPATSKATAAKVPSASKTASASKAGVKSPTKPAKEPESVPAPPPAPPPEPVVGQVHVRYNHYNEEFDVVDGKLDFEEVDGVYSLAQLQRAAFISSLRCGRRKVLHLVCIQGQLDSQA